MKQELLSPAGNMEALKCAIHNGADAVYISGKNYGARHFAKNFNNNELIEAIKYAHLYDVKVYVTVNTLIYENEINDFINYIKFLYENNVDAVLMQDIGMISLVKSLIPNLEIHASTQSHNCNNETLRLLKNMGIKRVVLARELSLKEIKSLNVDIEKEVFVYGALCICYSGCCLMSSMIGTRSANRGMCAGPCRLPYTLIMNDKEQGKKYFLSTRELNTTSKLSEILNSNIQSLKIEGRMKSPEYVGYVTKIFRNIIDNKKIDNYEENLKKLFNRGFTTGHLFKDKIINSDSPGHQGIKIGSVLNSNKYIKIKLNSNLRQNDGIRFLPSNKGMIVNKLYDKNYKLISKAYTNDIVYVDNKFNLKNDTTIFKTFDYDLTNSIKNYDLKKLSISYNVKAKLNEPLIIEMKHNNILSTYKGNIVTKAKTSPTDKDNIIKHLSKLGNTPFEMENINIEMDDNIFIPVIELNNAKRFLTNNIIYKKTNNYKNINISFNKKEIKNNAKICISAFSNKEDVLIYLLDKIDRVYTDNFDLYIKYKCDKLYYKLPRTNFNLPDFNNENLLVTELGSFYKYYKNNNIITDYTLNVTNSFSSNYFNTLTNISVECTDNQINDISKYSNNELLVYGKIELMVMNYCLIKDNVGCKYCKCNFKLKNKDNLYFDVINENCKNKIIGTPINKIDKINNYKNIKNFRLDFYDESINDVKNILKKITHNIHNIK